MKKTIGKWNTKIKKIIIFNLVVLLNLLTYANFTYANFNTSANVYSLGDCGQLLTYKGVPVKVSYVEYVSNGIHYPAYCMDKTKPRSRN